MHARKTGTTHRQVIGKSSASQCYYQNSAYGVHDHLISETSLNKIIYVPNPLFFSSIP
jgi:hypothetical protein